MSSHRSSAPAEGAPLPATTPEDLPPTEAADRPRWTPVKIAVWVAVALLGGVAWTMLALHRGETINAIWFVFAAVATFAIGNAGAANAALFAAAYVAITALSLPIAVWLTLAGGALFGFWAGLAIVSFASAIGATLAFLAARYLLRDWVRARLADHSIPRDVHFVDELPRNAVGKVVPRFLPGLGQKN